MALIKQFTIIFSIYSISDIFGKSLKLPIPANVIGMFLLFILLLTGMLKEHHIDKASDILINNMALFIPATLAIMEEYKYIKEYVIPFLIICIFMVIVIMVSTGLTAQFLERLFNKLRKENKK